MSNLNERYFPNSELTRYGFQSHLEHFMRDLLNNPVCADVDDYLKEHEIDKDRALNLLLIPAEKDKPETAIMTYRVKITPQEMSEEDISLGKTPKDNFEVTYKLINDGNYRKKMRNLYISNFESNIIKEDNAYKDYYYKGLKNKLDNLDEEIEALLQNKSVFSDENNLVKDIESMDIDKAYKNRGGLNKRLNEEDGGGATSTCSCLQGGGDNFEAGSYTNKVNDKPITRKIKTVLLTQEQLEYIKEATAGDIGQGYDAPAFSDPEANNHKNICMDKELMKGGVTKVQEGKKIGCRKKN